MFFIKIFRFFCFVFIFEMGEICLDADGNNPVDRGKLVIQWRTWTAAGIRPLSR